MQLCGHSYAGMVITGVADRVPQRISRLVYIDAYVPDDDDSCWVDQRRLPRLVHRGCHIELSCI